MAQDVLASSERLKEEAKRHTLSTPCNIRGCGRDGVWGFGEAYPSPIMWFCPEHEPSAEAKAEACRMLRTGGDLREAAKGLLPVKRADAPPPPRAPASAPDSRQGDLF